jgi:ATP-dependent exoDNAse (exonuclease V) beta subunit
LAAVPLAARREDIEAIAIAQARILGAPPDEQRGAVATAVRVLEHPLFDAARAALARGRCRREAPVTLSLDDGTLVEGVVDLAFEHDGHWVVVDYKTDRELSAAGEERYRRQVRLYARAIERALAVPTRGVLFRL